MAKAKEPNASHQDYLHFLESMDRINRAMQGTYDLSEMMSLVLDEVLAIFDCDRAFLLYPCDPNTESWTVPMERTRPAYPGVHALGIDMPMDSEVAGTFRLLLDTDTVLKFGPGTNRPLPREVAEQFGFKSFMAIALHPKCGKAWEFGIHQCSHDRVWTAKEERLLLEVGHRLADGLTSLLIMQQLQESEAKYRRFVETSNDGICALDEHGRVTFANRKMFEMLGYAGDELLGKPITGFMFEADIADHEQHQTAHRQGEVESYERRFRNKNGNAVWTLISASPIFDDKNVYRGSFVALTDITERKQAEEKVHQSEQRLRLHTELSPLGFLEWDENFCAIEWNAACEKIFGYTREEAIGRHAKDLILPAEVRDLVDGIYHDLMNQTGGQHSINENITKDGRTITVEWFNTTLINEDGKAIGVASVCRDITEQKQAEERLALLGFALNNVHDAAFLIDQHARFHFVNEESCRVLGYSREELLAMGVEDVDPDFPAERWPAHWQHLIEEKSLTFEGRHRTKEGRIFPVEISANFIDYAGQQYNFALVRDIAERKQSEQTLSEKQELLLEAQRIAHLGSWRLDLATNQVTWSEELYKMYGYDPALPPPLYTESAKLFTAESWERLSNAIARAVETGIPYKLELEMISKAGNNRWMLARGEMGRDEQGKPAWLRGVVQDITERKQAEKKLLESEQLFRALVENSPDFIARYDLEYRRIYVNPAIQALFKVPLESVLGHTPADQSPIKTPQVYIDHLRKAIETASECVVETPFRTAQGEMHWGQIRFVPEFDADGKVSSVLTIGRDIHEIKESEQRLSRFISNLPAFFYTFRRTEDGRYCFPYASPGIKAIYGLEPEDVREDMALMHSMAHPDDRPHIEADIARAFETLEPFRVEFRVCRPNVPERWIEARSVAHKEVDGSLLWYGIMLDITQRKRAQEELRKSLVETIRAIAITAEKRDPYTGGHQNRVSRLCETIGRELGLDAEQLEGLRLGAMIHNIGNIYVPTEILNRPGKLQEMEFAIIKSHAQIGYEIVKDVKFPWPVAKMILQHHERLDGMGYPNGLKGEEILLEARIIAVADLVVAMTSHRPYRPSLGVEVAMAEIESQRGTKYDPAVVDACLKLYREGRLETLLAA